LELSLEYGYLVVCAASLHLLNIGNTPPKILIGVGKLVNSGMSNYWVKR